MTTAISSSESRSACGYLETDKPENVRFYEKSGFETIDEAEVVGT